MRGSSKACPLRFGEVRILEPWCLVAGLTSVRSCSKNPDRLPDRRARLLGGATFRIIGCTTCDTFVCAAVIGSALCPVELPLGLASVIDRSRPETERT